MRYSHFDMLPEKAFQPVGKRMTLEGGGFGGLGGLGSVLGTAGSIAAGGSPLGAFGSTLGSQLLQGGGGGGSGGGGSGGGVGIGTQNQTQIVGPFAGMNPASIPYQQELLRMQQQQQEQQQAQQPTAPVQPQVQPQVQQPALTQTPAQMGIASLMPQQSASPSIAQMNTGMGPKGLGGVGPRRPPMRGGMAGKGGGVAYPQQGGMAGKGGNVPKQMLNKTFGGLR